MRKILQQCRHERTELAILEQKREEMMCSLAVVGIHYDKAKAKSSQGYDRIGETIPELVELDKAIVKHMRVLYGHERQALEAVNKLENSRYRQLLELYYLTFHKGRELYTWPRVADVMGYSEDRIKHLHGEALRALDAL